jgi:hypothetical protein
MLGLAMAVMVALCSMTAAIATAEGAPTRDEYAVSLEKICKPRAEETVRTMRGVRGDVRAKRDRLAAAKFAKAGRIFAKTVTAISVVARPTAYKTALAKWFRDLKRQEHYLPRIATQLRVSHAVKAQHLTAAFIHSGNRANDAVLAFNFDYCKFKYSRFS